MKQDSSNNLDYLKEQCLSKSFKKLNITHEFNASKLSCPFAPIITHITPRMPKKYHSSH